MKYEEKSYKQTVILELNLPTETFLEKEESKPFCSAINWSKLAPSFKGKMTLKLADFTCLENENHNNNLTKENKSSEKLSETNESQKQEMNNLDFKDNSLMANTFNNNNEKLPSKREEKNIDLPVREEKLFKRLDEYRNKIHKITSNTTDREDTNLQSSKINTSIRGNNRSFSPNDEKQIEVYITNVRIHCLNIKLIKM
jgi:hypothetical protein